MTLVLDAVCAKVAGKPVLEGLSLQVGEGEIVALIGSPGCGKSTILKAVFGRQPVTSGRIKYRGESVLGRPPAQQIRSGIAYVEQGGKVFRGLSVAENLGLAAMMCEPAKQKSRIDEFYSLAPRLAERRTQAAGSLSGGERQMLALAMGMITGPSLILLDEPSTGLSPIMTDRILDEIRAIVNSSGASVLLVEQNIRNATVIGDRVLLMSRGVIAHDHAVRKGADLAGLFEAYAFSTAPQKS